MHLKPLKLSQPVNEMANRMAALTPGFTGADIANICNEAAIVAARRNKAAVDLQDFEVSRYVDGYRRHHHMLMIIMLHLCTYTPPHRRQLSV